MPIVAGAGLTAARLIFLRFGAGLYLGRPALSWTLIAATAALRGILEARLCRSVEPARLTARGERKCAANFGNPRLISHFDH